MRVAVIGAGWFGCHIAASLIKKGIEVTVYEKSNSVFTGASRYNTGRLHLGFHYSRSAKTRAQSREGFNSFVHMYPELSEAVDNNLYLVSSKDSILDFDTYLSILKYEKYEYQIINPEDYGLKNMEGGFLCSERAVNHVKAGKFFEDVLVNNLCLNHEVKVIKETGNHVLVDGEQFDYCINCSYYTFAPGKLSCDIVYENVVTLMLEPTPRFNPMAFVIMDGDFFSLNPFFITADKIVYSLYHVTDSVVHKSYSFNEALQKEIDLKNTSLSQQLNLDRLKEKVTYYYPSFSDELIIKGSFVSTRTKLVNNNANRECILEQAGRIINVLSGKVNSIFEADDVVAKVLQV